jgi:tetratricopeptide (TPR) repeat protein
MTETPDQSAERRAEGAEIDFFISRRGASAAVAQEVAQTLIDSGYTCTVQDFDISYSANFLAAMHDALKRARHLIVLLTKDYDQSDFTLAEVTNFLAAAVRARGERRLVVLRVDDCEPVGLLAGIVYADLVGVADPEARKERILAAAEGRPTTALRRPKLFENVPVRDLNFTGRDENLADLHNLLMDARMPTAINQAAIHGLGGIGKTSLAAEYAHRYASAYSGVWWASAEQRTLLVASLAALAGKLDARLADEPNQEKAAKEGFARLSRSTTPFLLIYDNVETPETLRDLVPSAGARVLVTTRYSDWGGQAAELKLNVLDADVAANFLQKRAGRSDAQGAILLSNALGRLPLALDHAGAYCKLTGTSFDIYRQKAHTHIARAPKGAAYPASIGATFDLAIEKAATECAAAEPLLGFFAFLAPERIPLDVLTDEIAGADDCANALMALASVSLIEHVPLDDGAPAVTLHRLVQAAMRMRLTNREEASAMVELLARRLAELFPHRPSNRSELWMRCAVLLPHVLALHEFASHARSVTDIAKLLAEAGNYLMARAAYRDAEQLLREALAICQNTLGRQHDLFMLALIYLALVFQQTGRDVEAEPLIREAITIGRENPERQDFLLCAALNNIAILFFRTDRFQEAEPLLRESIAIAEKTLGRNHRDTALTIQNLARVLGEFGRYKEAEALAREALAICENAHGRENWQSMLALHILGRVLQYTGRYEEAEAIIREAIAICERVVGRDHPTLANLLNNLAGLLIDTRRCAEAEPLIREAVAIEEKFHGREHQSFSTTLNNLARFLIDTERYTEAEAPARAALAIFEKTAGPNHPITAQMRQTLARALLALERGDEALAEGKAALSVREKVFGTNHPRTQESAQSCAEALDALGRRSEAAALCARHGIT